MQRSRTTRNLSATLPRTRPNTPDARHRFLTVAQFRDLVNTKGARPLVLVSARRFFDQSRSVLPPPVYEDRSRGFVFAQYKGTEPRQRENAKPE